MHRPVTGSHGAPPQPQVRRQLSAYLSDGQAGDTTDENSFFLLKATTIVGHNKTRWDRTRLPNKVKYKKYSGHVLFIYSASANRLCRVNYPCRDLACNEKRLQSRTCGILFSFGFDKPGRCIGADTLKLCSVILVQSMEAQSLVFHSYTMFCITLDHNNLKALTYLRL